MTVRFHSLACAVAAALGIAVADAAPAPAADDAPAAARLEELRERAQRAEILNEREEKIRDDWQRTYRDLLVELRDATTRQRLAKERQQKLKSRIRYQGEQRTEVEIELRDSAHTIASLQEEIAELRDRAREADVRRSWLDEVEREFTGLSGYLPAP
mgnify:CR=1 FL=1